MPLIHTVKVTHNKHFKIVEVIGSGDTSDEFFLRRVFRELGKDITAAKFDRTKYLIEVLGSREIKAL